MSVEIIAVIFAIIAVGAAISGLIVTTARGTGQDIAQLRTELGQVRSDVASFNSRTEYLGGLVEGLRDPITHRERPAT